MGPDRSPINVSRLSPADAMTAIASFPRRYRRALAPVRDDEAIATIASTPGPDGFSAVEIAAHTIATWTELTDELRAIHLHDDPTAQPRITKPGEFAGSAGSLSARSLSAGSLSAGSLDTLLDRLEDSASAIIDISRRFSGKQWQRSAVSAEGVTVTALDLVKEAVVAGHDNLSELTRVLTAVRSAI